MKNLLIPFLLFFPFSLSAQDSVQVNQVISKSAVEKILFLTGASLLYAGLDYVGYNSTRYDPTGLLCYRVFQVAMQVAISYFLYKEFGLPTAIGFNIIWWTFGDDLLYYGYASLINPGGKWESRNSFPDNVMANHTTWAYWTPLGILRGMNRSRPIAGNTLLAQALLGAVIGITVTVTF